MGWVQYNHGAIQGGTTTEALNKLMGYMRYCKRAVYFAAGCANCEE